MNAVKRLTAPVNFGYVKQLLHWLRSSTMVLLVRYAAPRPILPQLNSKVQKGSAEKVLSNVNELRRLQTRIFMSCYLNAPPT